MMRTYSIIFDEYGKKWVMEKSMAVIEVLKIFLKEFAHDERRRPEIKELVLGLDVWEYLIYSNYYNASTKTLQIYDFSISIEPDWICNPKYIELKLV